MQLSRSTAVGSTDVAGPDDPERAGARRRRGARVRSLAPGRLRLQTGRSRRRALEQRYQEFSTVPLPEPLLISSFAVDDDWDDAAPATGASMAVSEHLAVPPQDPMSVAFAEAAELLERWDAGPWTPASQPDDDTAEWVTTPPDSTQRPEAIDLSDGPKLIVHPSNVPAQRIARATEADEADEAGEAEEAEEAEEQVSDPDAAVAAPLGEAERSALIADVAQFAAGLVTGTPAPQQLPAPAQNDIAHDIADDTDDDTADPAQLLPISAARTEPLLAAVLAAVASLAAWGTMAPPSIWLPLAVLPLAGLLAMLMPGGDTARLLRAVALLTAASVLPTISSALTPVTLLIALAVVATYPLLAGPAAGRCTTAFAVLALIAPLAVEALRTGPAAFLSSFLDAGNGALTAVRVSLAAGIVVVALIGVSAMATRRMLTTTASQAATRERSARQAADRLGLAAACDEATGLPNRQELQRRLAAELNQHDSTRHPAGLALIEIDRFSLITDSQGAQVADDIATEAGLRLRAGVPAQQLVARVSGQQFAVLLPQATAEACEELARTVMLSLEHPITIGEHQVPVTCSMGTVVHDPQDGELDTPSQLLRAADEALRSAQRRGRSQWVMFDQAVRAHTHALAVLELELAGAIRDGAIEADYQPMLALGTGDQDDRIVGAEALARWTRTDGSTVAPARFIAMADELGLGVRLGLHMVELALDALLQWRHEGVSVDQVWVSLAPSQLREPDLALEISAQLAVRGLTASCLVLEVSATTLAQTPSALAALSMLRSLGVAIALDDFGRTGTSLTALRSLPISAVKIDHEMAAELGHEDAVPRSVAQLCHSLGLRVVIQGVETIQQLHGARAIEVDAVQGYAIARPMSAQDVTNLLSLRLPRELRLR